MDAERGIVFKLQSDCVFIICLLEYNLLNKQCWFWHSEMCKHCY